MVTYKKTVYKTPYKTQKRLKALQKRVTNLNKFKKILLAMPQGEGLRAQLLGASMDAAKAGTGSVDLRRAIGYYGAGDYGWKGAALRGLGEVGGSLFGHGSMGRSLGARASRYLGFGDYAGDAGGNQIMAGSAQAPITVNSSSDLTGDIYMSHREYVGNLTATANINASGNGYSTFTVNAFQLNAGLSASFPWLAQIAQNFTLYEFEGLIYEYKPTSGEFGTTGTNALGKVIMGTQYDPDAPDWISSVQMENYDYTTACKPSEHMVHGVETKETQRATNLLYVRTGESPKDKVLTDVGRFQIATEGIPLMGTPNTTVTANIGEIWVTYRIKLSRAQLFGSTMALNVPYDQFFGESISGYAFGASTAQYTTALGPGVSKYNLSFDLYNAKPRKSNNIGCILSSGSDSGWYLIFPKHITTGVFRIRYFLAANNPVTLATQFTPNFNQNCEMLVQPGLTGELPTGFMKTVLTTTASSLELPPSATVEYYVKILGAGAETGLECSHSLPLLTNVYADIVQIPNTLLN